MTPEELLLKAADEIATRGHAKRSYRNSDTGGVCAYGAMTLAATGGRYWNYPDTYGDSPVKALIGQAAELLARQTGFEHLADATGFDMVTYFNDADDTTGEDVILAMKRAAKG